MKGKEHVELKPFEEIELLDLLEKASERISFRQRYFWELSRVDVQRWDQDPNCDSTDEFWAVAVFGQRVIYYNEIEREGLPGLLTRSLV